MSDPIKALENFNHEGLSVTPLAPSEVRRLGDRRRHRRNALAAGAGVAAVAAIAVPLALLAGSSDPRGKAPNPAPQPTGSTGIAWRTTIPTGFPITLGYPATNGNDGSPVRAVRSGTVEELDLCGRAFWRYDVGTDRVGATYTGEAEDARARTLVAYPDDTVAKASLANSLAAVQGCPEESSDGGATTTVQTVREVTVPGADEALVFTQQFRVEEAGFDTGLTTYVVARVGNAVLVNLEYGEGGGSAETVEANVVAIADQSAKIAEKMCVFAADPCDVEGETTSTPGVPLTSIPDDFPLDAGIEDDPEQTVTGPSATADGVAEISPCDRAVWPVKGTDRLAVDVAGTVIGQGRELVLLASPEAAAAVLEEIRSAVGACPDDVNEADPTANNQQAWTILPAHTRDLDSVTLSLTYKDGGSGATFWRLARVGRAVVAVGVGGEYSSQSSDYAVDQLTGITEQLTPHMCGFDLQGC